MYVKFYVLRILNRLISKKKKNNCRVDRNPPHSVEAGLAVSGGFSGGRVGTAAKGISGFRVIEVTFRLCLSSKVGPSGVRLMGEKVKGDLWREGLSSTPARGARLGAGAPRAGREGRARSRRADFPSASTLRLVRRPERLRACESHRT